jgi:hypothetical protein
MTGEVIVGAPPPVVTIGHQVLFVSGSARFKLFRPVIVPIDLIVLLTELANPDVDVNPVNFQSI